MKSPTFLHEQSVRIFRPKGAAFFPEKSDFSESYAELSSISHGYEVVFGMGIGNPEGRRYGDLYFNDVSDGPSFQKL